MSRSRASRKSTQPNLAQTLNISKQAGHELPENRLGKLVSTPT